MSLPRYNTRLQSKLFLNTSIFVINPSYIQYTIDKITNSLPHIIHYKNRYQYKPVSISFNYDKILTIKGPLIFIYQFLNTNIAYDTLSYLFYRYQSTKLYFQLFQKQSSHTHLKNNNCIICYKNMLNTKSFTTICNHTFHTECISKWILTYSKKYCPLCKTHLLCQ